MELIREIVEIYDNYEFTTEVLVASCRHPIHIVEAARMGADICTCPPAVIDALFNHPLTNIGLEKFLKDWEKVAGGEGVTDPMTTTSSPTSSAAPSWAAARTRSSASTPPAS